MLYTLLKPISFLYYNHVKNVEKNVGLKIKFKNLPAGWINSLMIFDMTPVWKKAGINAQGVNYFTIGNNKSNNSSRFDPYSKYYQAWLGGYTVKLPKGKYWGINDHLKLGEADQNNWLSIYGDRRPLAAIDRRTKKVLKKLKIGKYKAVLYSFYGKSHSDLGNNMPFFTKVLLNGMAYIYNKYNCSLKLKNKMFIPKWKDANVDPYHELILEGLVLVAEISNNLKVVLYGNGCRFTDKLNKKYNTFPQLKRELEKAFLSVKIEKV